MAVEMWEIYSDIDSNLNNKIHTFSLGIVHVKVNIFFTNSEMKGV